MSIKIKYSNSVRAYRKNLYALIFLPRRNMSENNKIQTGNINSFIHHKIDKTTYLVQVHFSKKSTQSVEDKLKRVIMHDLKHGK
jgi:hypothetical protein